MAHMKHFEHLKIQLEAIISATNNFSEESCIGGGGFGRVYRGKIAGLYGQTMLALKRLDRKFGQGDPEFWKELMLLSRYKDENIVSLLGFCNDSGEKILVYEYLPNKSLDLYLDNDGLRWIRRLKICIGAARGLAYLHRAEGTSQQRVLHRDIKSSNILLDEDWNAKISDFGLSKLGPANQEYTFLYSNPAGTPGYLDPLYVEEGLLTKESDVYSFGVVLFEVLCGRLCFTKPPLIGLVRQSFKENTILEIVYGNIKEEIDPKSLQVYANIAYQCLKRERHERPLMRDVVGALEAALRYQFQVPRSEDETYLLPKLPSKLRETDPGKITRPIDTEVYFSEDRGDLVVTIEEGDNLKVEHPFVIASVGQDTRQTKVWSWQHHALNTRFWGVRIMLNGFKIDKHPIWNETFKFSLIKPTEAILHMVVCSELENRKKQEILGTVNISVADVVKAKQMHKRYLLENGWIVVKLQWKSLATSRFTSYFSKD